MYAKKNNYNRGGRLEEMLAKYMKGGMMKYDNGGPITSGRDTHRPGREALTYREPSKEMLDRNDGFFELIPMEPEQGGVLIPRQLEAMERIAVRSGDPEAIAEYEAAMTEFMDSPEYKEQQEALKRRFQSAKSQYGEAKTDYDTRKKERDEVRAGMRMLMNSRLQ